MTTAVVTEPGTAVVVHPLAEAVFRGPAQAAVGTYVLEYDCVRHLLSGKPLRRPGRLRPLPNLSNRVLLELAKKHQPPQEWFEGEEVRPF